MDDIQGKCVVRLFTAAFVYLTQSSGVVFGACGLGDDLFSGWLPSTLVSLSILWVGFFILSLFVSIFWSNFRVLDDVFFSFPFIFYLFHFIILVCRLASFIVTVFLSFCTISAAICFFIFSFISGTNCFRFYRMSDFTFLFICSCFSLRVYFRIFIYYSYVAYNHLPISR